MIRPIEPPKTEVPPEEVAERIAFARRLGFENRVPPVVVYHPPFQKCPWDGCDYRIAGMRLALENYGPPALCEMWSKLFWLGPGLLARCPGCRRYVLYDVESKQPVLDPSKCEAPPLPDNWHEKALISTAGGRQSA